MTAYPDDVMKAARKAARDAYYAAGMSYMAYVFASGMHDDSVEVQAAARAILAERERCARVAKSFDERTDILKIVGHGVAAAIRKGE